MFNILGNVDCRSVIIMQTVVPHAKRVDTQKLVHGDVEFHAPVTQQHV